jgi:hypothetical protein
MSIACDAPWLAGCVMREEYRFNFPDAVVVAAVMGVLLARLQGEGRPRPTLGSIRMQNAE